MRMGCLERQQLLHFTAASLANQQKRLYKLRIHPVLPDVAVATVDDSPRLFGIPTRRLSLIDVDEGEDGTTISYPHFGG